MGDIGDESLSHPCAVYVRKACNKLKRNELETLAARWYEEQGEALPVFPDKKTMLYELQEFLLVSTITN
jgi:hypothetical protein